MEPDLKRKLMKSLGKLHDNLKVDHFTGLTVIVTVTEDDPSIVNVDLPEKDEILGCTEKQLRKSGFPMEIIEYGFPLKALGTQEQETFRATQKQDRFAVHVNLGERGHMQFCRSPNYYPTRATQRFFHRG